MVFFNHIDVLHNRGSGEKKSAWLKKEKEIPGFE